MRITPISTIVRFFLKHKFIMLIVFIVLGGLVTYITISSIAPRDFPRNTIVRIPDGATVTEVARTLNDKNIISSEFLFKIYIRVLHSGTGVRAGSYLFDTPQSVLRIAYRTAYGVTDLTKVRVTIPEGSSSKEIAVLIHNALPTFDVARFLTEARAHEGYLYPETYFLNPDVTPSQVIELMRDQFETETATLQREYKKASSSAYTFDDIVIMASLIEEEANNTRDRVMISGVLWRRLDIGMPLQVDAPFYYLFNKGSSQLTVSDLATSSPYNTYKNKGLPVGPISNPGIDSLKAALNPQQSKYLFYLADRTGVTHYAITHEEHVENKWKYLQ